MYKIILLIDFSFTITLNLVNQETGYIDAMEKITNASDYLNVINTYLKEYHVYEIDIVGVEPFTKKYEEELKLYFPKATIKVIEKK